MSAELKQCRRMVKNEGGLVVTDNHPANPSCAGYLYFHEGKAYDPSGLVLGVDTQEVVDRHNKILSQMEIDGLDKNCEVGQGCMFYARGPKGEAPTEITTWIGDPVGTVSSATPYYGGWKVKFSRRGRVMEGKIKKGDCYGYFECVSKTGQTATSSGAATPAGAAGA